MLKFGCKKFARVMLSGLTCTGEELTCNAVITEAYPPESSGAIYPSDLSSCQLRSQSSALGCSSTSYELTHERIVTIGHSVVVLLSEELS